MNINLVIIQPLGYVHSLGFLDIARALRHGLRRIGLNPSISKNRFREDCINWILGGHLGLRPEFVERHRCVFVNLEQIGQRGAPLPAEYLELLQRNPVLDYDAENLSSYRVPSQPAGLFEFSHVPYLDTKNSPLRERQIDLLFYGSINERRRELFRRIEAAGVEVTHFDKPIYSEERDDYIRNSKAVLNCSFYETHRFEQVRAFHCLSMGTPLLTERIPNRDIPRRYSDSVFFFDPVDTATFFGRFFRSEEFFREANQRLRQWRDHGPGEDSVLRGFVAEVDAHFEAKRSKERKPWRPTQIHLGSGRDYRIGWLNVDVDPVLQPDLVFDLSRPIELPIRLRTELGGEVELLADSVDEVLADGVVAKIRDLPGLMHNILALLRVGGRFTIRFPFEGAPTAWQDPSHLRAFNQNSWLYCTDWFWQLGWFDRRFRAVSMEWQDLQMKTCDRASAAYIKLVLEKTETTPWERTVARTMQSNFSGIPEDR